MTTEQIDKLTKLKELFENDIINEDEFAQEKAKVMSDFEPKNSPPSSGAIMENETGIQNNNLLLLLQIASLVITVVMCILFATSLDPVAFGIIGFITAIITIILSWIKQARIPKAYAIISTVVAGLLGLIMLIAP